MINLDPIHHFSEKLSSVIRMFVVSGVIFIILGVAVIFFPSIVQYLFVLGFIAVGVMLIVTAVRLENIRNMISRFEIHISKKL